MQVTFYHNGVNFLMQDSRPDSFGWGYFDSKDGGKFKASEFFANGKANSVYQFVGLTKDVVKTMVTQ